MIMRLITIVILLFAASSVLGQETKEILEPRPVERLNTASIPPPMPFPVPSHSIVSSVPDAEFNGIPFCLSTLENLDLIMGVFDLSIMPIPAYTTGDTISNIQKNASPLKLTSPVVSDGIAHVRYNLQNGPIAKGDYITISSEPGVGMKATESGFTVGVALENSDATEKPGLIRVRVMVRYERF
jgi:hypothetical protein